MTKITIDDGKTVRTFIGEPTLISEETDPTGVASVGRARAWIPAQGGELTVRFKFSSAEILVRGDDNG